MKQVIRFTASWCQPCKVYAPTFERVASETSGVQFKTIDVDSGDPLIIKLGIRNVPTTVVLNGEEVISKQSGNIGETQLKQMIG
jgi:thiol-disulfide isomerase/thioredoxin